jgi:uncharacterized protein
MRTIHPDHGGDREAAGERDHRAQRGPPDPVGERRVTATTRSSCCTRAPARRRSPVAVAIDERLAATSAGIVRRLDFRYRREGRKAPDRAPKLMAEIRDHLDDVRRPARSCWAVGRWADGWLDGGRRRRRACRRRPMSRRPRARRLPACTRRAAPTVSGSSTCATSPCRACSCRAPATRSGAPDELGGWTATIPGPVTHVWIDGARHELRGSRRRRGRPRRRFIARVTNRLGGSVG